MRRKKWKEIESIVAILWDHHEQKLLTVLRDEIFIQLLSRGMILQNNNASKMRKF